MTTTVVIDKNLRAPAQKVWAAIESVGGLDRWFPIIDACRVEGSGEGALRVMTLSGGAGEMRDHIVELAPRERRLRYHRTHHPFPVSDYRGAVEIFDSGSGRAVSSVGDGWTCNQNSCTRSDALLSTLSYPPITVIVNVATNAPTPESNTARVSGGGSASTIATDVTVINTTAPSNPPVLSIAISHSGAFTQGQQNAAYTLTVSNKGGASSTSGSVDVSELLPPSLTVVSLSGTGWVCTSYACTRSDALSGGSSYPVITVTVNVAANAPASVVNMAVVSGGGSAAQVASNTLTIQQ